MVPSACPAPGGPRPHLTLGYRVRGPGRPQSFFIHSTDAEGAGVTCSRLSGTAGTAEKKTKPGSGRPTTQGSAGGQRGPGSGPLQSYTLATGQFQQDIRLWGMNQDPKDYLKSHHYMLQELKS